MASRSVRRAFYSAHKDAKRIEKADGTKVSRGKHPFMKARPAGKLAKETKKAIKGRISERKAGLKEKAAKKEALREIARKRAFKMIKESKKAKLAAIGRKKTKVSKKKAK